LRKRRRRRRRRVLTHQVWPTLYSRDVIMIVIRAMPEESSYVDRLFVKLYIRFRPILFSANHPPHDVIMASY
jgi:hypothetical protein